MATKPLRPCRHPGCFALVPGGYCVEHQPKRRETPDKRSEEARSWRWMYQTDEWRKRLRPEQLLREPWCRECAKYGQRTRATDVDHIIDHKGDWKLFCDASNLQSLCHSCHSRKTAAELQQKRPQKQRR